MLENSTRHNFALNFKAAFLLSFKVCLKKSILAGPEERLIGDPAMEKFLILERLKDIDQIHGKGKKTFFSIDLI